ncbi:D-lactate dehydrogenase [Acanthocystis turfacea Chlorella virus TN603.4.2]|nr:D-lactate dehydrogenase [Acanthocystis turfacea Chlorella virus TN603.4.2]
MASTIALTANKPSVAVFSSGRYVKKFLAPLEKVCAPLHLDVPLTVESAHLSAGCTAVNVFVNDDLSAPVLDVLHENNVKIVTLRCAGFDRLDIEHAKKLGFVVYRVPAYSPRSVAELALTHMMALHRNLQLVLPRVKTGNFSLEGLVGSEATGKTIGMVGTGKIAQEFIKLVKPMAGRIIAYDIYENEDVKKMGVEYTELSYVLQNSDVLSLHCPLTEENHHLIDRMTLRTMKSNAIIINTARGGLIDTSDLIEALETGRIAGAAVDVYENESGLFFTNRSDLSIDDRMAQWDRNMARLSNLPNTIVSPHVAFLTGEALNNIAQTTLENLEHAITNDGSKSNTMVF